MDKIERFYFYKMYSIIMTLLQSDSNKTVAKALHDADLDISKCYELYCEDDTPNKQNKPDRISGGLSER